jgi:two-component system, NtrC family, response regulator AtoC
MPPTKIANGINTVPSNGHPVGELPPEAIIFGRSEAMGEVRLKLEKLADTSVPVLIQGESGTGKEIIARLLHQRSPWSCGPFVKVNCPAIPGTLVESELFGYEKGAFTGAEGSKPGRVELAHGGTLFLDEIAELEGSLQAKLLQLLQDGQFYSIGGKREKQVDVRFLCATNRDLERATESGTFRYDLFYRINGVTLMLPSLRERECDIADLVEYFLEYYSKKFDRAAKSFSKSILPALKDYPWPGNIRELENLIKSYVIFGSEANLVQTLKRPRNGNGQTDDFGGGPVSLRQAVRRLETRLILDSLQRNHWNRRLAARALKISYRALLYKLKNVDSGLIVPENHSSQHVGKA